MEEGAKLDLTLRENQKWPFVLLSTMVDRETVCLEGNTCLIKAITKSNRWLFHNMEHIKDNRFLKENVLQNIESDRLPITLVPRTSIVDWLQEPNSILFSHSRFIPLRIGLLNALWLGLPVIHNSPVLRALHPLLSNVFYTGNSV